MPYGPNDYVPRISGHDDDCKWRKGSDCDCGDVEIRVLTARIAELEAELKQVRDWQKSRQQ